MLVSDYIVDFLQTQGVTHVFEVAGGMITPLLDSLCRKGAIKIISVHHEQAAGFAAEGLTRVTGVPSVAMATSGPGAVNLLTAIGSCYFDSIPTVFITGQVNVAEMKGLRSVRQLGFQETDIVAMSAPITKAAWCVTSAQDIPVRLEQAFRLALSGRPGPVLLDIPMDIQRSEVEAQPQKVTVDFKCGEDIRPIIKGLCEAKRPIILAGGGLRSALKPFRRFVTQIRVPVVNSLMAVDALPYNHPFRVGMIGTYGNRWANLALSKADYVLVLGSRLDVRQTGSNLTAFKALRRIVHVDCHSGEINNRVMGCVSVVSRLEAFLQQAIIDSTGWEYSGDWLSEIAELKRKYPDTAESKPFGINPNEFMHQLSSAYPLAYCVDVGQHQMWAAQSLELLPNQRFITSGGMGAMGSALPLGIGASFAGPVVVIAGDGGFQLNIQELQTIVQYNLPIKIVIIDNNSYGMVRQFQDNLFEGRYQSTVWGYSAPDFVAVARSYGIPGCSVHNVDEVETGLNKLWADDDAFLLQVFIDPRANAYPKVQFGQPLTEMEP